MRTKTFFLVSVFLIIGLNSFAQILRLKENADSCKIYKFWAQEKRKEIQAASTENKLPFYKSEFSFLLKGQAFCGKTYSKTNYSQIISCGQNILKLEKDSIIKISYIDTLFLVYQKIDSLNFGDKNIVLKLAEYSLIKTNKDIIVCDNYYVRAYNDTAIIKTDIFINNYFYNLYLIYVAESNIDAKSKYKKRLISEYFVLCRFIEDNKLLIKTREAITSVFNNLIENCDDLLPELKVFMSELPQDKDLKIQTVNNFLSLLKEKSCTGSKEYKMLLDTIIRIDKSLISVTPKVDDSHISKANQFIEEKRYSEAIKEFNSAKATMTNTSLIEDIDFRILEIQYHHLKNYKTVYSLALNTSGSNKSKALLYAARCVAMSANDCGATTFERKCNYYYAADLCERAGDNESAKKYRQNGPTSTEKFNNNNPSSIKLSCWGVTVSIR
jgi:hypothetical protein